MAKPKKRSIRVEQGVSGLYRKYSDYLRDTFDKGKSRETLITKVKAYPKKVEQEFRNKAYPIGYNKVLGKEIPLSNIQAQQRHGNIAKAYFNEAPTISNLYNGAVNWLKSKGILSPDNTGQITGDVPTPSFRGGFPNVEIYPDKFTKGFMSLKHLHPTSKTWDRLYKRALKKGDIDEAQRLRDLHFVSSALRTHGNYLGNTGVINVPDIPSVLRITKPTILYKGGKAYNVKGLPNTAFTTTEKRYALNYTGDRNELEQIITNKNKNKITRLYGAFRNKTKGKTPFVDKYFIEREFDKKPDVDLINSVDEGMSRWYTGWTDSKSFKKYNKLPYDDYTGGKQMPSTFKGTEFAFRRGSQLKSANPIVYDDNGNIIPLSKRDNFRLNDIRYGIIPLLLGAAGYSSYNNNTRQSYKTGGTIHIKPENRGKFNALKKRTGKTTEELTHSKNPLTRKRAIFAQNARKWNHKKK